MSRGDFWRNDPGGEQAGQRPQAGAWEVEGAGGEGPPGLCVSFPLRGLWSLTQALAEGKAARLCRPSWGGAGRTWMLPRKPRGCRPDPAPRASIRDSDPTTPSLGPWEGPELPAPAQSAILSARRATSSGQHVCCAGAAAPTGQLIYTPEPLRSSPHSKPTPSVR